ncbi:proton-conducting transporter membrane subunit [Dactylosporangium sp. NBC_01737]|uniref:proton-conducting transporter transmembrane domain-containing protein n=1 Tax=Dactylosporangium sp. NBC_01737 TaxID=2975959 RepID=UPI002E13E974|nr:proton-conducting transporter membrane subunit [Dactylosporangium sp. NBC_01737]
MIGWALAVACGLAGLGVLAAVVSPRRVRAALVGAATAGVGLAGLVAGVAALRGQTYGARIPGLLPLTEAQIAVDPLGGWFLTVTGGVLAVTALYGIGYAGHGHAPAGRGVQAAQPVFAAVLLLVPAASSASTFLVLWELMAVTSLVMVLAEHRARPAVAEAGWWYAVLTHLGFVAILLGLVLYAANAGGDAFADLRDADLSPALRGVVFVLVFVGFGSKAGLVPLHVWLPRAHAEAPSPISAMLSAAMVNVGVYGMIRVGFDLLGGGTRWWWLLVLAVGAVSALYGILQATVAADLKRLLAYSTVENMGLVFLGLGAAGIFHTAGAVTLAALAMAAALLHVLNHAGFKALLFTAAGSVLRATGSRDLDALGGLRSRMPATTALFAVGALGASALPPGNGFVSEWLLLQSLVQALPAGGVVTAVAMPLAVAVVALTAGLAVATFVKALGVGFFARPRSDAAASATESPPVMLAAMGILAAACTGLALAPQALGPALSRAVGAATGTSGTVMSGGVSLRLAGIASTMSPLLTAIALVVAVAGTAGLVRLVTGRVARRRAVALWDCGAGPPTARMQYTATSFAEPLQRVFDDVLAPETDVDVTPHAESAYLVARVAYQTRVPDRVEHALYTPLITAARQLGRLGPVLANGSVHRYLGYGFFGVTGLLLILAVTR